MKFLNKLFGNKSENQQKGTPTNSNQLNIEKEFKKTIQILNEFKRTAYLPVVKRNANTHSTKSKIGGFPYLRNAEDWPICPNCKKNMQLFLQLNLEELPIKKDSGLIQLFYCTSTQPHCESDLEAFFPFSKGVNCRMIKIEHGSSTVVPNIDEQFGEKVIIDWKPVDDFPHFEEYAQLGIDLELDDDVYELMEQRNMGLPVENDKLFGWPYWVQSVEYPYDRNSEKQMELVFQFISEDNLPYMFGDVGIGHLTQSPDNKNELGFGWACS